MASLTQNAKDAYSLYKKIKKARGYYKLVKESIEKETRPGALFKLSVKVMVDLAGKALGKSLTSHPYFAYHKAHLEALAQALNASAALDEASATLNKAIRSADAAETLAKQVGDFTLRKNALKVEYGFYISGSALILSDYQTNAQSAAMMKDSGHTPQSLRSTMEDYIFGWRARWCELYFDAAGLLAMADVEYKTTEAAMKRFDEMMAKMAKGGSWGTIISKRVEQDRQWEQFDRMTNKSAGDARAVEDPTGYAKEKRDTIEAVLNLLAEGCDIAMSDAAYDPNRIAEGIGAL